MTERTTIKMAAKKTAPKPTRRVFAPDQCHHRGADGQPDCRKKKWTKNVNLCETHEKAWQKAARERAKARVASKAAEAPTPMTAAKPTSKRRAPRPPRKPVQRVAVAESRPASVHRVPPTA